jgi:pSer/pThr/pTyr-binding forkhead associated (FHA) protein
VSEAQLNILNYALLALLYLFFARVLWAVWSEVRGPRLGVQVTQSSPRSTTPDATSKAERPATPVVPAKKNSRAKRGVPSRLVVLEPKVRKGSAYPIKAELTLGRAPTCSIGIPDDTFASQLHTRVFPHDGAVWVEDLGSTNGTHVNGGRLSAPVQLAVGDRLQIGSTIFEAQ